jgi:hypothetical protein
MKTIATASIVSSAGPDAFFARWADMATWPQWNADTEWVRLDGPFVEGATGALKPKGGPRVAFVVAELTPGRSFVDVSKLFGARLTFDHRVSTTSDHHTRVEVTISMAGPLSMVWTLILGRGLRASAQRDLDALARVAEGASAAA